MNIEKAAIALKQADAIIILAGAGMGVDSGLPDFRGNEGFWKAYPPIAKLGISFSEMANPRWFAEKPKMAWAFYGHRLNLYRQTIPHKGFAQLLEIAKQKTLGYFIYTSNVDGQFQKAGFDSEQINEIHGSIHHFQCTKPCSSTIWNANKIEVNVNLESFEALEPMPHCPKCGALARPNILMFGDWNWIADRSNKQAEKYSQFIHNLLKNNAKVALIELGAGKAVPSVRMQSQKLAKNLNAKLIRINPRDYELPEGNHFAIAEGAAIGIQKLLDALK